MNIKAHAIDRYRERFNPFISTRDCNAVLTALFADAERLEDSSVYVRELDCDYYLNKKGQIIFVVRDGFIITVYPTPQYREENSIMDLNVIYLKIAELRKLVEDYKGHKPAKLKELENFLKGKRNA